MAWLPGGGTGWREKDDRQVPTTATITSRTTSPVMRRRMRRRRAPTRGDRVERSTPSRGIRPTRQHLRKVSQPASTGEVGHCAVSGRLQQSQILRNMFDVGGGD
jgi:hypothetical protein